MSNVENRSLAALLTGNPRAGRIVKGGINLGKRLREIEAGKDDMENYDLIMMAGRYEMTRVTAQLAEKEKENATLKKRVIELEQEASVLRGRVKTGEEEKAALRMTVAELQEILDLKKENESLKKQLEDAKETLRLSEEWQSSFSAGPSMNHGQSGQVSGPRSARAKRR